ANPTVGRPLPRKPWKRRQQAILGSPLWLTGIHLLRFTGFRVCGAVRRQVHLYRFRNAATGKWLSAIVWHKTSNGSAASILHITKGKASPEAMRPVYF
ncbi:hypothetical protein AAVH_28129, partial [Aphelenchoides avenae]